jgi:hypothetical protein
VRWGDYLKHDCWFRTFLDVHSRGENCFHGGTFRGKDNSREMHPRLVPCWVSLGGKEIATRSSGRAVSDRLAIIHFCGFSVHVGRYFASLRDRNSDELPLILAYRRSVWGSPSFGRVGWVIDPAAESYLIYPIVPSAAATYYWASFR